MIDTHRNPSMEKFIGKRVRVEQPHGTYFGVLNYSDGWYIMDKPEYRSKNGEYHRYNKWSFRRSHVKVSKVHVIEDDAVISKD